MMRAPATATLSFVISVNATATLSFHLSLYGAQSLDKITDIPLRAPILQNNDFGPIPLRRVIVPSPNFAELFSSELALEERERQRGGHLTYFLYGTTG